MAECTKNESMPMKPASNVLKDAAKEFIYILSHHLSFGRDTQSLLLVLRNGENVVGCTLLPSVKEENRTVHAVLNSLSRC